MSNTLTGQFEHTVDAKGRLILPSKLRDKLGDSFIVTLGLDGCLYIFSPAGWDKFTAQLEGLPGTEDVRKTKRRFMANAAECDIDKQGRTLIPAKLREKVGIDKDVIMVGMLNKIELWSKERFEEQEDDDSADVQAAAETLAKLGVSF